MRFVAIATDYDGTLAHDGRVSERAVAALDRFLATGRRLILVTGRELDELLDIFPAIDRFECVVAENGALLYFPASGERQPLGEPPPAAFVQALRQRGVPISVGASIVATVEPHETVVLETIRDLGLELQVIFNKEAVMVLPASVNKASGLMHALTHMALSPHNVAAIGDAENDHALLHAVEYGVAVANAIPALKETADYVSAAARSDAVIELIDDIVRHDLRDTPPRTWRHRVLLGHDEAGMPLHMEVDATQLLVAGTSGSGKSTLATGVLERLCEQHYQFCVIDPEGDYEDFADGIVFGNGERSPSADEVMTALEKPDANAIVNLVALPLKDRPAFFLELLPRLQSLRARTGRPHWVLVDETHHLMPRDWDAAPMILAQEQGGMIYVTVHPESIAGAISKSLDLVAVLGEAPAQTLQTVADDLGLPPPHVSEEKLPAGQALLWRVRAGAHAIRFEVAPQRSQRQRHRRKYAEGELTEDRSFYFRGPQGKLRLRAQNLFVFLQMGEGVDDETWLHHLHAHDYSKWMREFIKDPELGEAVAAIERDRALSPADSRRRIRAAVEQRYTLPAGGKPST